MSKYQELRNIDVHALGLVQKKGALDYLSWAGALDLLLKEDESATYTYDESQVLPDGSVMVATTVRALGKEQSMILPVLDFRNKAIPNPNAFQVNTAYQRCLAKNISVISGIGLSLYLGEIGVNEDVVKEKQEVAKDAIEQTKQMITQLVTIEEKREFYNSLSDELKESIRDWVVNNVKQNGSSKK